jgi:pimeloyl-ACP methyl ester carboxylesterase
MFVKLTKRKITLLAVLTFSVAVVAAVGFVSSGSGSGEPSSEKAGGAPAGETDGGAVRQGFSGDCSATMFVVAGWQNGGLDPMLGSAPAGYVAQEVPYPNSTAEIVNAHGDVAAGVNNLNGAVNAFYDACGVDAPSIIVGYSLGALVAGDVLQTQPAERNIQGLVFSDARRLPESGYPGDPGGLEAMPGWSAVVPGEGLRGFNNPTVSLCYHEDSICFGTSPYVIGHPEYTAKHTAYAGWNVAHELDLHGWGNWKNVVW